NQIIEFAHVLFKQTGDIETVRQRRAVPQIAQSLPNWVERMRRTYLVLLIGHKTTVKKHRGEAHSTSASMKGACVSPPVGFMLVSLHDGSPLGDRSPSHCACSDTNGLRHKAQHQHQHIWLVLT